jgi:hypothetical protein
MPCPQSPRPRRFARLQPPLSSQPLALQVVDAFAHFRTRHCKLGSEQQQHEQQQQPQLQGGGSGGGEPAAGSCQQSGQVGLHTLWWQVSERGVERGGAGCSQAGSWQGRELQPGGARGRPSCMWRGLVLPCRAMPCRAVLCCAVLQYHVWVSLGRLLADGENTYCGGWCRLSATGAPAEKCMPAPSATGGKLAWHLAQLDAAVQEGKPSHATAAPPGGTASPVAGGNASGAGGSGSSPERAAREVQAWAGQRQAVAMRMVVAAELLHILRPLLYTLALRRRASKGGACVP